jgi:RimJ/RimL family protein N-acetyltransferase
MESGGAMLVTRAGTEHVIGSSRFHGYSPASNEVEIGWTFLARACWGGTWNRELKRLMVEHAFRFVDRVLFVVAPMNLRSQHAVLKIGGVRSGSRFDAAGVESYIFALTPGAWEHAMRG